MATNQDKAFLEPGEHVPEGERPISIPDSHYAAIGKVADAWADLEFEIDRLIWSLLRTNQALGACVTAQMIGPAPRLRAVRALVALLRVSAPIAKELGSLEGAILNLGERRNRAMHDKRLVRWSTKEVIRFQVTAQRALVFEPVPESADSIETLAAEISRQTGHFIAVRNRILAELLSSPERPLERLPYILDVSSPI